MSKLQDKAITLNEAEIDKYLYIVNRADELVRYNPKPFQIDLEKKLTGRDLVLKYRQGGASTFFVERYFKKAITSRARIGIMAHDSETTQKLRRMAQVFWENLPESIRPERGLDNARTTSYKTTGSEITIATAGSINIGRGGTYGGGFLGDEVAFWKDAQRTMTSIIQGVPINAPIALISTPNGASGWFYEQCMKAINDPQISAWTFHFYAWWWEPEYKIPLDEDEIIIYTDEELSLVKQHGLSPEQIKFRRYKKRELGAFFAQEYPEDPINCFMSSGGGVFSLLPENIQHGITRHDPKNNTIYVAGLDWGQDNDYTVLSIFEVPTDGTAIREVFIDRWRKMSWSSIRGYIVDALNLYKVEKIMPEKNSMGANVEGLRDEIYSAGLDTAVHAFITSNRSKDNLVKQMNIALDEQGLQLLDVDYANHEMRIFETQQTAHETWTYGAPKVEGAHDDCVIARMLANYAASQLWI